MDPRAPRAVADGPRSARLAWSVVGVGAILGLWALAATRWPPHVLPGPLVVADTIVAMRAELAGNALATGRRVLAGYGAAVVTGIPLAAAMGASGWVDRQVGALLSLVRGVPPFAWTPLLLLWLGIGEGSAVAVVFLAALFPVVGQARAGIAAVPTALVIAARNLGATPIVVTTQVLLPGALPLAFAGLRLGWTLAWMSVVAAELVGADGGLGQMVLDARNLARPDIALAGMATIGALAASTETVFAVAERRLLRWRA